MVTPLCLFADHYLTIPSHYPASLSINSKAHYMYTIRKSQQFITSALYVFSFLIITFFGKMFGMINKSFDQHFSVQRQTT